MKILKYGIITLICLNTSAYALPVKTEAGKLAIANHTPRSLSFSINHVCSTDIGLLPAHTIKTLPTTQLIKVCAENNNTECTITAHEYSNCSGDDLGGVTLNFAEHSMAVTAGKIDDISIYGTIGDDEYDIFYVES